MSTTLLSYLKAQNAYPIPTPALAAIVERRGLEAEQEATAALMESRECRLCVADVLRWVSFAPGVSQGGQSFALSEEQRKALRAEANAIYHALGENSGTVKYGYKGSRL